MSVNWRAIPFVRPLSGFVLGIFLASLWSEPQPHSLWFGLALAFLIFALLLTGRQSYTHRWRYGFVTLLFFVCLGLYHRSTYPDNSHSDFIGKLEFSDEEALLVELIEPLGPNSSGKFLRFIGRCVAVGKRPCRGKLLLYFSTQDEPTFQVGDLLLVPAALQEIPAPLVPHTFDYRAYMAGRQIYFRAFIGKGDFLTVGHVRRFWHVTLAFRERLLDVLHKHVKEREALAVIGAMVLGERRQMDASLKDLYARTGAMHVLAVSGLHMGLIYFFMLWLFQKAPLQIRNKKGLRFIAGLWGLWGFALLTGASPSALRAAVLFSFLLAGQWVSRQPNTFNSLAASAFCLLWYNPLWLSDLSFQLSYSAILGILLFQRDVFSCWFPQSVLLLKAWKLTSVSIAAQISTMPLGLYYFHRFSNGFWLSSLLAIPAAPFVLLGSFTLFLCDCFSPALATRLGWILERFVILLNEGLRLIAHIPGQSVEGFFISKFQLLALYAALACIALAWKTRRGKYLLYGLTLLLIVQLESGFRQMRFKRTTFLMSYPMSKGKFLLDAIAGGQRLTLYTALPSNSWERARSKDFRAYLKLQKGVDLSLAKVDSFQMNRIKWKRPFLQLDTVLIYLRESGELTRESAEESFGADTTFFVGEY